MDAFVILKNEADIARVKPVFDALNNLCQRIFSQENKIFPDPIGINPSRLIGTADQLFQKLKNEEVADVEATTTSLLTAKPILPQYQEGERLRELIMNDETLGSYSAAKKLYDIAINQYNAPNKDVKEINIKKHVMRPLDFILMGLRDEFKIHTTDGAHLSAPGTIRLLREGNYLPVASIDLIEKVYNQAMKKRFQLHGEHKGEHDHMPAIEAQEMLQDIEQLRELAKQRIQVINNKEKSSQTEHLAEINTTSQYADNLILAGLFIGVALSGAIIGVGLALSGVFLVPITIGVLAIFATAVITSLAAVGIAALTYGIIKATQSYMGSSIQQDSVVDGSCEDSSSSYSGPLSQLDPSEVDNSSESTLDASLTRASDTDYDTDDHTDIEDEDASDDKADRMSPG